ncbi:hypothetical protein BU23DRAFT_569940 [Bimuria novae-zelandiae CBS 107.79]|uniref:RBR-type E3 ubiquitin transferase n=1 Tax=Bimuria novae-zelandiae CBS 107.79 TaxID=1447943 RepID=A0A6A5V5Y5_9PLEO|nr:hypothetical protein BU23DRAFT_569940 [Bimuria novae-zelandiae CBS 107.79]
METPRTDRTSSSEGKQRQKTVFSPLLASFPEAGTSLSIEKAEMLSMLDRYLSANLFAPPRSTLVPDGPVNDSHSEDDSEVDPGLAQAPVSPNTRRKTYECSVCTEQLPRSAFLRRNQLPATCHGHLLLSKRRSGNTSSETDAPPATPEAVCRSCLSRYLVEQFRTRGADRVQCIKTGCVPPSADLAWKYFALPFLPAEVQEAFGEELARGVYSKDRWVCPASCAIEEGWIATPEQTSGWPHVECPTCQGTFCARCRVQWHASLSCKNYQRAKRWEKHLPQSTLSSPAPPSPSFSASAPSIVTSTESEDTIQHRNTHAYKNKWANYRSVLEMQHRGARLCPRCQTPIIKDGGCGHMTCAKCDLHFKWGQAEKVYAVKRENVVAKRVRAGPVRYAGAWVWRRRRQWGLWKEKRRWKKGYACGVGEVMEGEGYEGYEGEERDAEDEDEVDDEVEYDNDNGEEEVDAEETDRDNHRRPVRRMKFWKLWGVRA